MTMKANSNVGRIVWHDLKTNEVDKTKDFYANLLGWQYHIEQASVFAWRPGEEADYPLIMANDEAHGSLWIMAKKLNPICSRG